MEIRKKISDDISFLPCKNQNGRNYPVVFFNRKNIFL